MKKIISVALFTLAFLSVLMGQNQVKPKVSNSRNIDFMVNELKSQIGNKYFDKAKGIVLISKLDEMLVKHLLDTSSLENAAAAITEMLRKETNDKHFNLVVLDKKQQAQQAKSQAQHVGGGISGIKVLEKNIGYLKWDACIDGDYSLQKIKNALTFLENCSALIIDISDNPGGGGQSGAYFNSLLYSSTAYQKLLIKRCTGDSAWHQSEVVYDNSEYKKYHKVPIYVLVSNQTASAAEYFALTVKETKRGKILGQTSAGAGNPGFWNIFSLSESETSFYMFIPSCQITTKKGFSIEGIGVTPDIELKSSDRIKETVEYILSKGQLKKSQK